MAFGVALVGLLIAALGVLGLVNPPALRDGVKRLWGTGQGMRIAFGLRLALGAFLWLAAPECRFPTAIRVLGGITFVSGLLVPVVGSVRITALLDWWLGLPAGFVRGWACIAMALGSVLLYAGL
jgi:hypothetical protein